ncbi:MAG TPA: hypothetical protein VFG50_10975 [Rhodothermales bacterium]|nr:hypothetical protein [Rhodothermales bacterium]
MLTFLRKHRLRTHLAPLCGWAVVCLLASLATGCDSILSSKGGGEEEPITLPVETFNTIDSYPAWSRDGKTIAYTHFPQTPEEVQFGADMQVWLLDLATGRKRFLTVGWLPAWSPDGGKVAFVRGVLFDADIYVIELATGEVAQLTDWGMCFEPDWSPDGKRIAFNSGSGYRLENTGIWTMNPDGSEKERVVKEGGNDPAWSPDGTKIAYVNLFQSDVLSEEILVVDVDGGTPRPLTTDERTDRSPAWSPDGKWIAWTSSGGGPNNPTTGVWTMHPDGSGKHLLALNGGLPSWSPDGKQIVYYGSYDERTGTLWTMNADGSDQRPLTRPEDYKPKQ